MNAKNAIEALRNTGWSDNAIACAIGCSQPTVTRIRQGKSDPRESIANKLNKLLLADQSVNAVQTRRNHIKSTE